MRITILGHPASGKSSLAKAIAGKLQIPHIQIDRFWFEAGGRRGSHDTPNLEQVRAHIKNKVLKAIQADSWVSDGFYSRVQFEIAERADTIIFLNISLWQRLFNHTVRLINRTTRHNELSMWDDILFYTEIVKRHFTRASKFSDFLRAYKDKTITLSSRKEIADYLKNLA